MSSRYCPTCKTLLGNAALFCPNCGGRTDVLSDASGATAPLPPQQVYRPATPGPSSNQLALWAHLAPLIISALAFLTSFFVIGVFFALIAWVPPLVIKSINRDNPFVDRHAKESFNFQIFWLIISAGAAVVILLIGILTFGIGLIFGGIFLVIIALPLAVFMIVVQIRACIAASAGTEYIYPLLLFRVMK